MRRWFSRWFAPSEPHRREVLAALTPLVPWGPHQVSWRVLPKHDTRVKSFEDWQRIHGQEKAS